MNELPDLPGVVRRTRPFPADGLERVMRNGRKRRVLFVGASGGAALAAVVLVLVALQPGVGRQSLGYTDLTTPTATPAATVAPGDHAVVRPVAEPSQEPASPEVTSSPEPTTSDEPASGSGGAASRPAYTETQQDEAAPLGCVAPPSGHTGPLYYGGGSACVSGSGGATTVKRGGSVSATVSLCAPYRGGDATLGYDTGREHDVHVYNSEGDLVYQFSKTVRYEQGSHQLTVRDGHCTVWEGVWDTTLTDGELAPSGDYRIRVTVHADSVNGRRTSVDEGAAAEFSVWVE